MARCHDELCDAGRRLDRPSSRQHLCSREFCALRLVLIRPRVVDRVVKPKCDLYFGRVLGEGANLRQFLEALIEMANGVVLAMRLGIPGYDSFKVLKQGRGD